MASDRRDVAFDERLRWLVQYFERKHATGFHGKIEINWANGKPSTLREERSVHIETEMKRQADR